MAKNFPSKETVRQLRGQYPEGTRIEFQSTNDPRSKLRPGDRGSVSFVDDAGTVHVAWDNGSKLGLVYGADSYTRSTELVFETGAEAWRDTAVTYGLEQAYDLDGRYLSMQMKREQPEDEKQFCRELFEAMYEAMAERTDPAKLVYPYDFKTANERLETSFYHDSHQRSVACANAIDAAINASRFDTYRYNLDLAAMTVIHQYGFNRVNAVLAHNLQTHESDGRYSTANKEWAKQFNLTDGAFQYASMNAHPTLLEDFTKHARKLYDDVGAERFLLPGRPESGEVIRGYEIVRSVAFDSRCGFAIGQNPDAVSPCSCWQFTVKENGAREFYRGHYTDDFGSAANNYVVRILSHMRGERAREVTNSMPGTLPEAKPSVLDQIREARKAPPAPRKKKDTPAKGGQEL